MATLPNGATRECRDDPASDLWNNQQADDLERRGDKLGAEMMRARYAFAEATRQANRLCTCDVWDISMCRWCYEEDKARIAFHKAKADIKDAVQS